MIEVRWICEDCGADEGNICETLDNRCCGECGSVEVHAIEDCCERCGCDVPMIDEIGLRCSQCGEEWDEA